MLTKKLQRICSRLGSKSPFLPLLATPDPRPSRPRLPMHLQHVVELIPHGWIYCEKATKGVPTQGAKRSASAPMSCVLVLLFLSHDLVVELPTAISFWFAMDPLLFRLWWLVASSCKGKKKKHQQPFVISSLPLYALTVETSSSSEEGRLKMMQEEPSRGQTHCWSLGMFFMTMKEFKEATERGSVLGGDKGQRRSINHSLFLGRFLTLLNVHTATFPGLQEGVEIKKKKKKKR